MRYTTFMTIYIHTRLYGSSLLSDKIVRVEGQKESRKKALPPTSSQDSREKSACTALRLLLAISLLLFGVVHHVSICQELHGR